ncbi:MAG: M23 family metallopeptidase [Ferruginibacter sp.]
MKKIIPLVVMSSLALLNSSYIIKDSPSEIAKQLVFPVTGDQANIGSVWGDERDGGKRRHEGIDIFAAKGTYVVAISDGYIEVIGNDDIGGNNITLQPDDYSWNAYYAHLDKIYVNSGQRVKKGQLIGSVGNTGNAKTTPPHLHFGIYTSSNVAFDPLPYIKTSPKITTPVQADNTEIARAPAPKKQQAPVVKKSSTDKQVETTIKNAAVQVITNAILRKIRIRL